LRIEGLPASISIAPCTFTLDQYSSGLTLQAAGLRPARWQCVVVDTVICTALCFLVIFTNQFNTYYSDYWLLARRAVTAETSPLTAPVVSEGPMVSGGPAMSQGPAMSEAPRDQRAAREPHR
jgi:hypothetical protein